MEVAKLHGRTVIVVPAIAVIQMEFGFRMSQQPPDARRSVIPLKIFEDAYVYNKHLKNPRSHEKSMIALAAEQQSTGLDLALVDHADLTENFGDFVIMVTQTEVLERTFAGVHFGRSGALLSHIHSSYPSYEPRTGQLLNYNQYVVRKIFGGEYISDFTFSYHKPLERFHIKHESEYPGIHHVSGHMGFYETVEMMDRIKAEHYILYHGENPDIFKNYYFGRISQKHRDAQYRGHLQETKEIENELSHYFRNVQIISRIKQYDPKNPTDPSSPIGIGGYYLRLD